MFEPSTDVRPYAVCLKETQRLLGGISRARVYILIGRGELTAIKDGKRTLVTLSSIEARQRALPLAASIKQQIVAA
jgi:hypothetical protein